MHFICLAYTIGKAVCFELYTRNKYVVCKEQLLSSEEFSIDKSMFLRKVSNTIYQTGGQG